MCVPLSHLGPLWLQKPPPVSYPPWGPGPKERDPKRCGVAELAKGRISVRSRLVPECVLRSGLAIPSALDLRFQAPDHNSGDKGWDGELGKWDLAGSAGLPQSPLKGGGVAPVQTASPHCSLQATLVEPPSRSHRACGQPVARLPNTRGPGPDPASSAHSICPPRPAPGWFLPSRGSCFWL